jgi:hypothetical protein
MNGEHQPTGWRRLRGIGTMLVVVLALCPSGLALAQSGSPSASRIEVSFSDENVPPPTARSEPPPFVDSAVLPAGCSTCGGGLFGQPAYDPHGPYGCGPTCTSCGNCYAGRKKCCACEAHTTLGRFFCGIYECICCNDPCYEPCWIPAANASFFADSARPQTQQRLRWDAGRSLPFPDRAEFFIPRADGMGLGPRPPAPARGETSLNYNDLFLYTEAGSPAFAFFTELSYREIDPEVLPHASGFGDMNLGTKSLLLDCELLQIAFQFKTYLLTGNFLKGLGTGHVSLEPSLLLTLRLTPEDYLQAQLAEWFAIAGDPDYAGSVLHSHWSYNRVLYKPLPDVQLIGTAELNTWTFQDGAYTDPILGPNQKASGVTYVSVGPGLRFVICNKFDIGVGTAFAVSRPNWAEQLYRTEIRWRF